MNIIIFDGDCAFCNESIRFILNHNKAGDLYVCASQSQKGSSLISDYNITESPEETLIFIEGSEVHYFSSAALEIAKHLDHFWAMLSIFLIVPKPIRDGVYKIIANQRKKIISGKNSCSLEDMEKFKEKELK